MFRAKVNQVNQNFLNPSFSTAYLNFDAFCFGQFLSSPGCLARALCLQYWRLFWFVVVSRLPTTSHFFSDLWFPPPPSVARLLSKSHCFVLGKGYGEPVAMEGALKLKEMSYIHAEGYSGGALKHGPFALIDGEDVRFFM